MPLYAKNMIPFSYSTLSPADVEKVDFLIAIYSEGSTINLYHESYDPWAKPFDDIEEVKKALQAKNIQLIIHPRSQSVFIYSKQL
jgi:hypothetical protein